MANTSGVNSDGSYLQVGSGIIPIGQSAIPSFTLTGTTSWTQLLAINIPPLVAHGLGPDSEIIVNVSWSCNSSANAKTMQVYWHSANIPWQDVQTTNVANEWTFRVSCRNSTSLQVQSGGPGLGGTTQAFTQTTYDYTQPTYFTIWGMLANTADNLRVERYSVYLANAPTYSFKRLNQGQKVFWGANAHYDDITPGGGGITTAQTVSGLQQLGCTVLRMTYENTALSLTSLKAMATALQGTGIQMYCCLDLDPTIDGTNLLPSEGASYAKGWSTAMTVINALKPLGVNMYECGNEMDSKNGINIVGDQGAYPSSFDPAKWPIFRGIIAGAVQAVQSRGCLAASNAQVTCGVGFSDMLWYGTAPDGSSGYQQVRWDITAWHNYQPWGPMMGIQRSFSAPYMNLYEYLCRAYGVPIYISEFNGADSNTGTQNATWNSRVLYEMYANRYKYNIMGCNVYQLFQGTPWAMVATPGTPGTLSTPMGTGYQGFITANPDTGT